jgi:hypothetical protein
LAAPGVGPVTAPAFTLTMGPAERFQRGKQIASYLGLIPSEYSSGGRGQRLGHISKQGNPFLRGLLVEAAKSAVRPEPEMRPAYQRLAQRKCRALAKVAMARKLAERLYWMLRLQVNYAQLIQVRMQDSPAHSVIVVKTGLLSGHPASPKRWGVRTGNHGPDAGWDRIDGWWNSDGSIERLGHEPWSRKKDFGLKKKHFQASARRSALTEPTSL